MKWMVLLTAGLIVYIGEAGAQSFQPEFHRVEIDAGVSKVGAGGCRPPDQSFDISRYELSNAEYIEFLNSVASKEDYFGLYSRLQTEHFWGGVLREGGGGAYKYYAKKGYARLPATFISWLDAARYINWIEAGKPNLYSRSEVELINHGAYELKEGGGTRTSSSKYFMPTCGEWRLAVFWDKDRHKYSDFATGDLAPLSAPPDPKRPSANYFKDQWALPFPHLAPVDAYARTGGVLNGAGNVMEWVEDSINGSQRMALGGSLFLPLDALKFSYRDSEYPDKKLSSFGFRIAKKVAAKPLPAVSYEEKEPEGGILSSSERVDSLRNEGWVHIGDPGNRSDVATGVGCVPYDFEIQDAEITNAQYVDFLNAVARKGDKFGLFVPDMESGVGGGISKLSDDEGVIYKVKPGMSARPVAYVSWFSLARYANWRHFGKPNGTQTIGVTEGDSRQGAYNTEEFSRLERKSGKVSDSYLHRNLGARYFIPSDDEWYKAAYYDPEKSGINKYWIYPGRSDHRPSNRVDGFNFQAEGMGQGAPHFVAQSARFSGHGYYKVYDLGGNLWEWVEDWRGLGGESCWRCDIPVKGLRGGSFNYVDIGLSSKNIDPGFPSDHYFVYGGRLARNQGDNASWCVPYRLRVDSARIFKARRGEFLAVFVLMISCVGGFVAFRYKKRRRVS